MVHPFLFLQFFRKLLEPLHITEAGCDAIASTWLVIALLVLLSLLATKALKAVPGGLQNFMEVIVGGIVPEADLPKLKQMGVARVFGPGTSMQEIVGFLKRESEARHAGTGNPA